MKFIDGMTALALKSNIETGSPKYIILSGYVLVYYVNLLAISVPICLPISEPIPVKRPPSEKPIPASTDAPIYPIPAAPAPTISSLTVFFV